METNRETYEQSKGYQRLVEKFPVLIFEEGFNFREIFFADSYPYDNEELTSKKQEIESEGLLEVMVLPFAFDEETGNHVNGRTILTKPKQEAQQ